MVGTSRIDSIVFDLKQSMDDLGNEIKLIIKELDQLNEKVKMIEEKGS
jgi:hypothetical protein